MKSVKAFLKQNKGVGLFAPFAVLLCALLPEYAFPVLLLVAFVKTGVYKRHSLKALGGIGCCLLGYAVWMAVGMLYTESFMSGLSNIAVWLFFLGGFLLMSLCLDSREKIDAAMFAGALSGGIVGGIGIFQIVLYHYGELVHPSLKTFFNPFWHSLDNAVAKLFIDYLCPNFALKYIQRPQFIAITTRASGTFTNPLFFATFLVMMLPFAAYCLFYFKSKKKKAVSLACVVLIIGGVAASYSRGPYLYLIATFAILLLYGGKKALALLGIGCAGLAALAAFAGGVFKRILTIFNLKDISVNTRSDIIEAIIPMLKENWLWGYGTGVNNVRTQLHAQGIKQPHAHNLFAEICLENGIFGVIILLACIAIFAVAMFKLARCGKKERGIAVTLLASVIGFFMCGITDYTFYGLKPICYMMLVFGISHAAEKVYLEDKKLG